MRRGRHVLSLLVVGLIAPVPAQGREVEIHGQDTLTWDPPTVAVAPGDTVTWTFPGTTQAHNVRSRSDNWSLLTVPAVPAPGASYVFETEGTYGFQCEVHPDTMTGQVTVARVAPDTPLAHPVDAAPPAPPAPPPPSQLPFANDSEPMTVFETGGLDRERPAVTYLRTQRGARRARVHVRVSEPSRVAVSFVRRGRTVQRVVAWAPGTQRITIRSPVLPSGRYTVRVTATDAAGNRSRAHSRHATLG